MGLKIKFGSRQQVVPSGEYRVIVRDIRKDKFIGKRDSLEFIFEIADGSHAGSQIRGFANAHYETFSEYTKIWRWLAAINAADDDPALEIDLDVFYDKVLNVKIETKISRKTGNQFSNVTDILGVACDLI